MNCEGSGKGQITGKARGVNAHIAIGQNTHYIFKFSRSK